MATTSWVTELDKKEHRNWVMVGCALNITKRGITQLTQVKMEAWYQSLISSPPLQSLPPCTCVRHSSKCATCATWKKELERLHKSTRPRICWENSDRQQWGSPTGAWEIAKVFMPTLGTRKGDITDASTTDIGGLLNLLQWCPFISPPVNRAVLSKVRDEGRNHWAHSPKQELQDADVKTIFGHLNNLLSDPVFHSDKAAQESSRNLQDLFHHGLLNVRESEVEALHLLRQSLVADLIQCKDDLSEVKVQGDRNREDTVKLRNQLAELDTEVNAARSDLTKGLDDLIETQDKITQLDVKIKTSEESAQKDILELKGQGQLHNEEITKLEQQQTAEVKEVQDLKGKISTILITSENFNRLLSERDDLQGALDVISNDLEDVVSCMHGVFVELNTTKSEMASLKVDLESMKSEVKEVTSEVETLKAKSFQGQSEEDIDSLCTAPRKLQEFTGRQSALVWLEQNLISGQSHENRPRTSCRTKTICGLGGCGKTSLAVEFAWRWTTHFTGGVFWINGESVENVSRSVAENLALLNINVSAGENIDNSLNRFLTLLSRTNSPWLLVVDNADELRSPTCPSGVEKICKGPWQRNVKAPRNGHILFTTRQNAKDARTFLKLSPDDCLELQCFSEEEGALFLVQRTRCEGEFLDQEAVYLAKELGGLPLALEQAAAYISALPIPCSFKAYLEKYRDVKLRLLEQQPVTALSDEAQHRLSVHTTWKMNFEFVTEKSPAAATMMRIASFLESENIPFDVINPGLPALNQAELRGVTCSEIDIAAVLKILTCYSLFSVDQQSRVFGVHKLVQEVVRDSLTATMSTETLMAAMRVLHFAFKERSKRCCVKFKFDVVTNWSEIKEEDRNILTGLLLNLRKLKDHLQKEIVSSRGNLVHVICSDNTFSRLFSFANRLIGMNVFFNRLKAELSEFFLQINNIIHFGDNPNWTLELMVNTCVNKRNCDDSESCEGAKQLAEETVQKLRELEDSGVIIQDDVKYRVLEHRASYYAMEGRWEKNYKALLELESLKLSDSESADLQLMIGRAENYVSACNFKLVLKRYKYTLELARKIQPPDPGCLLRVLQHTATLLDNEGKPEEARQYAEEMVEICRTMPLESDYYIAGMTDALKILSNFDSQTSENMLLNMLKERWPRIHKSVMNGVVETSAINNEDGAEDLAARVLESLLVCWSTAYETKQQTKRDTKRKAKVYLIIAQIALAIRKKFYGETHPGLETVYLGLLSAYVFLGNKVEATRCIQLLQNCDTGTKTQFYQGLPPCDGNMYATRRLKDRGNSLFEAQNYDGALEVYTEALSLSPNDAKLLSNRAATYLKLSEQHCSMKDRKVKRLEQALADSLEAITADPSWMKGYYWKAVCLAHLGKRGPSLATAAVAWHLFPSKCANIRFVVDCFGSFDLQVVNTIQELQYATGRTDTGNLVILMKGGKYELLDPVALPDNPVIVGLGDVEITCSKGVPLKLNKTSYMENITMSPTVESIQRLTEKAKVCLRRDEVDAAIALYTEALDSCPNDSKILKSRASAYFKSAEQSKDIPSKRKSLLQFALNDAEAAIKVDPSWLLGYHTKAVTLAELDRKPEALAAAAVFKHVSLGRDVSEVTRRYGEIKVQVVERSDELRCVFERAKELEGENQIVLIKEGEYALEKSIDISQQTVIVGQGKVSIVCKTGAPFRFGAACHVENVEMTTEYDIQQEPQEYDSNDTQSEVIRLPTPPGYEHTENECKVN